MDTTIVNEASRRYVYDSSIIESITFLNVESIRVSESGNHYLKYRQEPDKVSLAIVTPGWSAIFIEPGEKQDWTF